MSQNPTIDVTLKVNISPDSKLFELIQASSRVGLMILVHKQRGLKVSDALKAIYEEADRKLKDEIRVQFSFCFPIDNLLWDTEHYLSHEDHCILLAPEG